MAQQFDVLIKHTSDGISEYDNPLPMWWLGILWFTIVFSAIFIPYLAITGWGQQSQWEDEVAAANVKYAPIIAEREAEAKAKAEAAGADAGPTAAEAEAGKALFVANCVACHGADATGGIGPNLTDGEWIHGGTFKEIRHTVTDGVGDKGMPSWGPILGDEKVRQLSAYVHGLGGGK